MNEQVGRLRANALEHSGDRGNNPAPNPTMGEVIAKRFNRRDLLKGSLAVTAITATIGRKALATSEASAKRSVRTFDFQEIEAGVDETHHIASGYDAQILLRWGDPLFPDAPAFDPYAQTADKQRRQFGYNTDYVGYVPFDGSSDHGLLVANHEYTSEELMFPAVGIQGARDARFATMTRELVEIEIAAHGGSVVEIRREPGGPWHVVKGSRYTRRITADTPMEITGPAAGHERMKTPSDPSGRRVLGMINNCAGGLTPWGTWLSCEENFNGYFWSKLPDDHRETANYKRYGVGAPAYAWGRFHDRFDPAKEPNEANRFGWVVEIDPFDPKSIPRKRTALGRVKHEGAAGILNGDGRYVIYLGDDERFDYVYRFVTTGKVDRTDRTANFGLLDEGTLSVAKYNPDGTGTWLPLLYGQGPLTDANGFKSQADILIETRLAADLLGATKMDRPEDIEADPRTNRVYVMLTNNTRRNADQVDAANPRADNAFGHIIEMMPTGGDHAAAAFTWEVLVRCGDPSVAAIGATFSSATTKNGWFGMPDNCAVDNQGRLWICTDGNHAEATGRADGLWALETDGEARGTSRHFFRVPAGAEMCGPFFTPNDETLFLAVQHPGEGEGGAPATFEAPATRWPDFKEHMPPRPSVLAVTKKGGGRIA